MSGHHEIPAGQPIPEAGVEPEGIDTPTLLMWGFVSCVVVLGLMFASAAFFFELQNDLNDERIIAPVYTDSEEIVLRQRGLLAKYEAPTAEGDPYIIPIDRAMELVIDDLKQEASN